MKLNKITLFIAFILPVLAVASGTEHHEVSIENSDFLYRVLNFSIFAMLVYYLVSSPIRSFFKGRREDIANQLKEIEAKLEESKNKEKLAKDNFEKAKEKAKNIIADSHDEAKILVDNIAKKNDELLTSLEKHLDDKMEIEKKRAIKATVQELLESGIKNGDIPVDSSKVVSLISKKVA